MAKANEFNLPEDPVPLEEKTDEEVPATDDPDEVASDEIALDDEELNPFGDKWVQ